MRPPFSYPADLACGARCGSRTLIPHVDLARGSRTRIPHVESARGIRTWNPHGVCHPSLPFCGRGVYLFFITFVLGMLLTLLALGLGHFYVSGHVPKLILVARSFSLPPSVILRRVASRKVRLLKQRLARLCGFDRPRTSLSGTVLLLEWRRRGGRPVPPSTPLPLQLVATGVTAELSIAGLLPSTICFLQLDLQAFALRWAEQRYISLHAVTQVGVLDKNLWRARLRHIDFSSHRANSPPKRTSSQDRLSMQVGSALGRLSQAVEGFSEDVRHLASYKRYSSVHVDFRDGKGEERRLVVILSRNKADRWLAGLQVPHHTLHATSCHSRQLHPRHWLPY